MNTQKIDSFVLGEDNIISLITTNDLVIPLSNEEVVGMLNKWIKDGE